MLTAFLHSCHFPIIDCKHIKQNAEGGEPLTHMEAQLLWHHSSLLKQLSNIHLMVASWQLEDTTKS